MSATRKFALFLFAVCLLAGQAFADTVSLKFVNVGPGNVAPTGYYAYPYNFSINGSSTLTPMMCDAFNNHITIGESWTANVHSILQGGMFGTSGQALLDYKAAGLIFKGVFRRWGTQRCGNCSVDRTMEAAKQQCRPSWRSISDWPRPLPTARSRA
jgi:hypothetical protein